MQSSLALALALLFVPSNRLSAEDPPVATGKKEVSALVEYKDRMLILSTRDGVAAVAFGKDIPEGVTYRFRFLPRGRKKEVTGEGRVYENNERGPAKLPHGGFVPGVEDKGGQWFFVAGPIKLKWSYSAKGRGWIYYHPDDVRVLTANASAFAKVDLARFQK